MKAAEIRGFTDEQIEASIEELREEWRTLRFDDAVGRLTNTSRIRQIKRDIARLKTIQTERVISERIAALTADRENGSR
jgi:large subunit ribosomal protein L29